MQAARGTSLKPSDPAQSTRQHRPPRAAPAGCFAVVAVLGYTVDLGHQAARARPPRRGRRRSASSATLLALYLTRNRARRSALGTSLHPGAVLPRGASRRRGDARFGRRVGRPAGRSRSASCWPAIAGNLTDRMLPRARPDARSRHRLPALPELAGLQRRRHVHQHRGGADHPQTSAASGIDGTRDARPWRGGGMTGALGMEHRTVTVPDGLAGERVDAAMARMFGLSRSRAAELIAAGHVARRRRATSARATGSTPGAMLDVDDPRGRPTRWRSCPRSSRASRSSTTTTRIVVIDKPVGVAVHPSAPAGRGPTVVGHLAAAGFRIATSGASERQGIVQRLDVGTSGVMVIAKSEHAYSRAEERLPAPHGRQDLPRARAGPPRPAARAPSTPRSAGIPSTTTSSR